MADGGTLFLDEIGVVTAPAGQAAGVLEDKVIRRVGGVRDMPLDGGGIGVSNRGLERTVKESTFRQDCS